MTAVQLEQAIGGSGTPEDRERGICTTGPLGPGTARSWRRRRTPRPLSAPLDAGRRRRPPDPPDSSATVTTAPHTSQTTVGSGKIVANTAFLGAKQVSRRDLVFLFPL